MLTKKHVRFQNDDISAKLLKILSPPEDSDYNGYKNLKSKKKSMYILEKLVSI